MTRRDKLIREREHDPYQTHKKLSDPSACTGCGAMFRDGRWQWGDPPVDAARVTCPACQRGRDGLPAGILTLEGEFHLAHRAEILGLLRNIEEREVQGHALKRILSVDEQGETVTVNTAHPGLARSLGDAMHRAYGGELDYRYPDEGGVLRVRWSR